MKIHASPIWSPLFRYGLGVGLVALVVAIKKVPFFPDLGRDAPFLLLSAPAVIAAWYGGFGPGIVASVLGTLSVLYWFLPPYYDLHTSPDAFVHASVFGIESCGLAGLVASVQASRSRAEMAARRVEAMYSVSSALGATRTVPEVTEIILHEAHTVLGATGVYMYFASQGGGTLRRVSYCIADGSAFLAPRSGVPQPFKEVSLDADNPAAFAARTRATVGVGSQKELRERFRSMYDTMHADRDQAQNFMALQALLCVPMIVHDKVVGVLVLAFEAPRRFAHEDRSWAEVLAQDCGMAAQRTHLFEMERRARMEAEEANQAKDEFFSVVSRELSAPLTTIIGWAHLLKRDKGTDRARLEHALDVIERSAQAQSRLVDDMIDMSRIAAGRLRVDMKAIDLGPLVRSCADEMRSAAASKGIDLELQSGPAAQATVVADAERFRQVMSVVLDHAFRCTPPGGHVRVEVEPQERVVLVRVVDDGRGLSADKLRKVFEPFTRHDAWAGPDGGGMTLGLPIAKYILEQHRGQLRVESEGAGHGVAITLELPRADPLAGMLAVSGGTRTSVAPLDGVRVLLVDDDPGAREALAETLAVEGAEVRPVPSAQAAIDQLGDYSPDVVVSNLVMSEGDNNAFMRRVRGLPSPVAAVPALALVDHAIPEGTARAAEAGFQRQLPKPPEPKALIQAVGQLAHRPD